jgi:hypothetical protein
MSPLPNRTQHITTTQTTTTQIVTTEIIHDSDIFTEEDLERASAIFKKYYPDRTLESLQSELADSQPIDSVDVREPISLQPVASKQIAPPAPVALQDSTPPEMTRSDVREPMSLQPLASKQIAPPAPVASQDSTPPEMARSDRQFQAVRISARELHKYPLVLVGIFSMFLITYPISMSRVSQMAKFSPYGAHLKSLTPEYRQSEPK